MSLTEKKQNLMTSLDNVQREKARIEKAHEDIANAEQQVIGAIKLVDELIAEESPAAAVEKNAQPEPVPA